jgi:Cdc6-like AAA superfamily ATPase
MKKTRQQHYESRELKEILDWLTMVDFADRQNQLQRDRQEGTGSWFLCTNEFQLWASQQGQTLFCHGGPGAGKTYLASLAIHHLQSSTDFTSPPGVAYIYCDYREHHTQEVLISSLLRQLSKSQENSQTLLKEFYRRHLPPEPPPSCEELESILCSVMKSYDRCFFIVDALDECQETKYLLQTLKHLSLKTDVNILATCRDGNPRIRKHFQANPSLQIKASDPDIERYLDAQVPEVLSEMGNQLSHELCIDIKHSIMRAAAGMCVL